MKRSGAQQRIANPGREPPGGPYPDDPVEGVRHIAIAVLVEGECVETGGRKGGGMVMKGDDPPLTGSTFRTTPAPKSHKLTGNRSPD